MINPDNEKAASRGFDPGKNMHCILHSPDANPSMSLLPDGRAVHCFACGHTADYSKQGW